MIKEGFNLYVWSQCKKTKNKPKKQTHNKKLICSSIKNMLKYVVCTQYKL